MSSVKAFKFDELLRKELTRKQFIQMMLLGVVSVLGFQNVLSMLTRVSDKPAAATKKASSGFGNSKFGV